MTKMSNSGCLEVFLFTAAVLVGSSASGELLVFLGRLLFSSTTFMVPEVAARSKLKAILCTRSGKGFKTGLKGFITIAV